MQMFAYIEYIPLFSKDKPKWSSCSSLEFQNNGLDDRRFISCVFDVRYDNILPLVPRREWPRNISYDGFDTLYLATNWLTLQEINIAFKEYSLHALDLDINSQLLLLCMNYLLKETQDESSIRAIFGYI